MPNVKNLRVVFDSVILVSTFLADTSERLAAELFTRCVTEGILYTAEEIRKDSRRVLLEKDHIRNKYSYLDSEVERFIELVREKGTVVEGLPDLRVIERDPNDDMIIACAVAVQADYIVSRDRDLLDLGEHQGIEIVSPEIFMQYLRTNE